MWDIYVLWIPCSVSYQSVSISCALQTGLTTLTNKQILYSSTINPLTASAPFSDTLYLRSEVKCRTEPYQFFNHWITSLLFMPAILGLGRQALQRFCSTYSFWFLSKVLPVFSSETKYNNWWFLAFKISIDESIDSFNDDSIGNRKCTLMWVKQVWCEHHNIALLIEKFCNNIKFY